MERIITISPESIRTDFEAHNYLSMLANDILNSECETLVIDISHTKFIDSNQFAILGCIMDTFNHIAENTTLILRGVSKKLKELIQKNNFGRHFDLEKLPDLNNTVIPYRYFSVDAIEEYERYLQLYLLNRSELPLMTGDVKNNILDYLLEIFKNVSDHTSSKKIYTCGQYFPRKSLLYFTMVDSGETISHNVTNYFQKQNKPVPNNTLFWALQEGHSTSDDGPRGIGLYLITSFIKMNRGYFYIVSGKNTYEIKNNEETYKEMDHSFPGTIVTLAFNLKDDAIYYMNSGTIQEIQF